MSSSPDADYFALKLSEWRMRKTFGELYGVSTGGRKPSSAYFIRAETHMRTLCAHPDIYALEEAKAVLALASEAKLYWGPGAGNRMANAAKKMVAMNKPVLDRTGRVLASMEPPLEPGRKAAVVEVVRRYERLKAAAPQMSEAESAYADVQWANKYSGFLPAFSEVMSGLKAADPVASVDEHYLKAQDILQKPISDSIDARELIRNIPTALYEIGHVIGRRKADYGITDAEVGRIPELEAARDDLKRLGSVSASLLQRLEREDRRPEAIPFDPKEFEESLFAMTASATRMTSKAADGRNIVTTSEGDVKLVFRELLTKLEGTPFVVLVSQTNDILDNLHEIIKDPDLLERAIREYTLLAQLEIQNYRVRMKRKTELLNLV